MEQHVITEVKNQLGIITLDRAQALNSLSLAMVRDITRALLTWRDDANITAVVMRSNSEKAFCAGGDIRFFYQKGSANAMHNIGVLYADGIDGKRVLREAKLLAHLAGHENVVELLALEASADCEDVFIVTSLFETDLHKVIYSKQSLSEAHVRWFAYQKLRGLKFLHSAGVLEQLGFEHVVDWPNDDMPYALLKALGFGLIIGCAATAHGLYDRQSAAGNQGGSPASRALVSSFLLMSLFNLVVAYVFYGVLFYGLL